MTKQKSEHLETFSSGRVRLSVFLRQDESGIYLLYPAKPAYWYSDKETGKPKWSENLKPWNLKDAAVCYEEAHRFYEKWKKAGREPKKPIPLPNGDAAAEEWAIAA